MNADVRKAVRVFSIMELPSQSPHPTAHSSIRTLVTFMAVVALVAHRWLTDSVYPMALKQFERALGDAFIAKLPIVTRFATHCFQSPFWIFGTIIPAACLIFVWKLRSSWVIAVIGAMLFALNIALLMGTFFSLWFGEMMIVRAIEAGAKAKGLMP
jgi:hypothetical protein